MFKYLRMDAYRLIKTKTLYVALGIILAAVAFSALPPLEAPHPASCRASSEAVKRAAARLNRRFFIRILLSCFKINFKKAYLFCSSIL